MPDRNHYLARDQTADRVESARDFRRERDQLERSHREDSFKRIAAWLEIELRMRAKSIRGNERPFEMHAENRRRLDSRCARLLSSLRDRFVTACNLLDWRRDGCRQ